MQLIGKISVKGKILLLILLAVFGSIIMASLALSTLKANLLEDRQLKTRHVVEIAYHVLAHFEKQAQMGTMTEPAAQQAAIEMIKVLRYEEKDYFWINDMHPRMVMHPFKPKLDGKDLSGLKDPNGKPLFVKMVEEVERNGAGFVHYDWPKPGLDKPIPKLSYVKGFAPWGWIVGSGIYIDDINTIFWADVIKLAGFAVLVFVVLVFFTTVMARSITVPIAKIKRVMEAVEIKGDLTSRAQVRQSDELGQMAAAFDRMLDKLQNFIAGVNEAADGLTASTHRVSAVTEQTNQGVLRQRSETEQVATAMNEMSATVQETATNAAAAAEAAASADREANAGKVVVEATIQVINSLAGDVEHAADVIRQLETDALSVSRVLDVISGVAEQTNLLALNAAIEAARAGDQGRGFAVVADEVRTLAQRTQTSTEEIQAIIESLQASSREAVQAMENGTKQTTSSVEQAARAGEALSSITAAVGHISEMNTQIATAAEEQTAVVGEIDRNIVSISEVASLTATGTKEITAVSEETIRLAQNLQSLADSLSGTGR